MREFLQIIDREIEHKNFSKVKRLLNLGNTANSDEIDWKIYQFILSLKNGQRLLAIIFLQEALKKSGVIDSLYLQLSQLHLKNNNPESALAISHKGLLKFPLSVELLSQYIKCTQYLKITNSKIVQQRAGLLLSLIKFNNVEMLAFCYDILSASLKEIGTIWIKEDKIYGWFISTQRPKEMISLLVLSANHKTSLRVDQATPELKKIGIGHGFNGFCFPIKGHENQLDVIIEKNGKRLFGSPLLTYSNAEKFANPYTLNRKPNHQKRGDKIINIIIPIFNDLDGLKQCLGALKNIAYFKSHYHVVLINDGSFSAKIKPYLQSLKTSSQFTVIHNAYNLGFIASVNMGMQQDPWRDVILLNSDTVVVNDSFERLKQLAYSDKEIATVTPLSNYAEKFSYPKALKTNVLPTIETIKKIDRIAAKVNSGYAIETPTGNGFCFFIKRACLDEVGYFNQSDLLRGYSEESEFCLRATEKGWKHLCATHVYVGHEGGQSFKHERARLVALNNESIEKRYPLYSEDVQRFIQDDLLKTARKRIERRLLEQKKCDILYIADYTLHSHPLFKEQLKLALFAGQSVWILTVDYQKTQTSLLLYELSEGRTNLEYTCSTELKELTDDIKKIKPLKIEVHHSRYFPTALNDALMQLKCRVTVCPYDKTLGQQKPEWSRQIECLALLNDYAASEYQWHLKIRKRPFPNYFYTPLASSNYRPYIAILGDINQEQAHLIGDITHDWLTHKIPLTFIVMGDSNERYALESNQKVIFTTLSLQACDELKQLCSHVFILPNIMDFISESLAQALQFNFQLIAFAQQNNQEILALHPDSIVIKSSKKSMEAIRETFQLYAKKVS